MDGTRVQGSTLPSQVDMGLGPGEERTPFGESMCNPCHWEPWTAFSEITSDNMYPAKWVQGYLAVLAKSCDTCCILRGIRTCQEYRTGS